jgi:predicted DNA-binding transcriptional regulator AlpA
MWTDLEVLNMIERLMTATEAGALLAMTRGALAQLRYMGTGPKFVKLGGRSVRYRREDLEEWVARRTRTSTSQHQ